VRIADLEASLRRERGFHTSRRETGVRAGQLPASTVLVTRTPLRAQLLSTVGLALKRCKEQMCFLVNSAARSAAVWPAAGGKFFRLETGFS